MPPKSATQKQIAGLKSTTKSISTSIATLVQSCPTAPETSLKQQLIGVADDAVFLIAGGGASRGSAQPICRNRSDDRGRGTHN
jgi:hypothetical protein